MSVSTLPLLPVRDVVLFPSTVIPLFVGREKSIKAVESAVKKGDLRIFVSAQHRPEIDAPGEKDIYRVGTVGKILQVSKLPDGTRRVLIEGEQRGKIVKFVKDEPFLLVEVKPLFEVPAEEKDPKSVAYMRLLVDLFERFARLSRKIPSEAVIAITQSESPGKIADLIASYLPIKLEEKQNILETLDVTKRMERLISILKREIEIMEIEQRIQEKVNTRLERMQKEYYLKEKLKAIQEELGEETESEIEEYRKKIRAAKMPKEVEKKALSELERLTKVPSMSAEAGVIRTYLDWLISLPWSKRTKDRLDLAEVRKVLDEDHYGLEDVKERIIEYLAVQKLKGKAQGTILCLVGPPGVGKTSLGRSIARALGRKFVRMSLGGVRDEAEIRGHRRTYVGAMPGRIIQGIRQAGTKNPVFLLDEIDKLCVGFQGDPAAALLEALDPEQNKAFSDHYLEVPFDLSEVMFITTANVTYTIPPALLDRMEVIHLPGYTEYEKLQIAKRHLIPKQVKANGIPEGKLKISDRAIIRIIREYTREAGVRNLEREIAKICRKIAKAIVEGKRGKNKTFLVTAQNIERYLGKPKFRYGTAEKKDEVGVATGLAWTEAGGEILPVEVVILPGKGKLILTGSLGDVMKESAHAALSYIRSRSEQWGIDPEFYEKKDVHVHVPEGAIPKDGPSAGITIATAMLSAMVGVPVSKNVAMTGEITLRGKVIPVGGIKEKILAAHRAGIKKIILPAENKKDLDELPDHVKKDLTFVFVEHMDQVIREALVAEAWESYLARVKSKSTIESREAA